MYSKPYLDNCKPSFGGRSGVCVDAQKDTCNDGVVALMPAYSCGNSPLAGCCFHGVQSVVRFPASGSPLVIGTLAKGEKLKVNYEFDRLQACYRDLGEGRGEGYIVMSSMVNNDPGRIQSYEFVSALVVGDGHVDPTIVDTIDLPTDAQTIALWFKCKDSETYDSQNGANYVFTLSL